MPLRYIITIEKSDGTTVQETVQGRNQQQARSNVKTPGRIVKIQTRGK